MLREVFEKFNLSQAVFCFGNGFITAERPAGGFGHDDVFPFDFLYHNNHYTALRFSVRVFERMDAGGK